MFVPGPCCTKAIRLLLWAKGLDRLAIISSVSTYTDRIPSGTNVLTDRPNRHGAIFAVLTTNKPKVLKLASQVGEGRTNPGLGV